MKTVLNMPRARPLYDDSQPLTTQNGRDYVRAADGRLHRVRFVTSTGQIRVTALGQHYFRNRRTMYVAHVPVLIRGRRSNGQPYTRGDHLPVNALGVGKFALNAATTRAQVGREVRQRVLSELRVRGGGEEIILAERNFIWTRQGSG